MGIIAAIAGVLGTSTATAGAITAGVIGAGASIYEGQQQAKAAKSAEAQRQAAAKAEQDRIDEINRKTKPEEQSAGQIDFGSNTSGVVGSVNDFLIPASGSKQNTLGGSTTGRAGLGFA